MTEKNTSSFKVGDVVRLKSGGPDMTVIEAGEGGLDPVVCQWFNGKKREVVSFAPETLTIVSADKPMS